MSGERIETAGELDALPMGSVVVDRDGDTWMLDRHGWLSPETAGFASGTLARKWAPLTVVYRPDRDLIAEAEARGAREADAALTKALGQRDAAALTAAHVEARGYMADAERAEAVLREVAALHHHRTSDDGRTDWCDLCEDGPWPCATARVLARATQTGADR